VAYNKNYGALTDRPSTNLWSYMEDKPIHPMGFGYDGASGKHIVVFHPAGLQYPDLTAPTRTKAGVLDDTDPVPVTNGLQLIQYNQSRMFLVFRDAANAVVADGEADITVWHRARPGDDDAAGSLPGPWIKGTTWVDVNNYEEHFDVQNYHREVYVQLTNLTGTALDHVDIYITGVEDMQPDYPFSFGSGGALLVELKDVHVEVGNLEVQLEAWPDQVGEKADSIILASTLDHSSVVAGNYQPPVGPLFIDALGRVGCVGYSGDCGPTHEDAPVKIAGRSYDGTYAVLTTAVAGADNDLTYTARVPGAVGNNISVEYIDGGGGSSLVVGVTGTAITVTGDIGAGVTGAEVMAAILADYEASELVTCDLAAGNDGTGNIAVMGAANLAGGAGLDKVYIPHVDEDGRLYTAETVIDFLLSGAGIYRSPTHFTAAYASGTTLALTGLPFAPVDAQLLGVVEVTSAGTRYYYPSVTLTFAATGPGAGTLTHAGGAFGATSSFVVCIDGQDRGYDQATNSYQVVQMNAHAWDWVDSAILLNAHDLSASSPAATPWIDVKALTHVRLFFDWTSGTGAAIHNITVSMYGSATSTGTTEFLDKAASLGSSVSGASTDHDYSEVVYVGGYSKVKFYVDESGGTGKGTVTLTATIIND